MPYMEKYPVNSYTVYRIEPHVSQLKRAQTVYHIGLCAFFYFTISILSLSTI